MFARVFSFVIVFILLACTVAAVSSAVYDGDTLCESEIHEAQTVGTYTREPEPSEEPSSEAEDSYIPRLSAPEYSNACYYSNENVFYASSFGMPNCTCYAWGRAYELLGEYPELCLWDAGCWYDYNRDNGFYAYGDIPKPGAVACWKYSDGGPGHVAVVERVDGDTVTFSNSAYSGTEFYVSTAPVDDPSNGMETWIFQGYIYLI